MAYQSYQPDAQQKQINPSLIFEPPKNHHVCFFVVNFAVFGDDQDLLVLVPFLIILLIPLSPPGHMLVFSLILKVRNWGKKPGGGGSCLLQGTPDCNGWCFSHGDVTPKCGQTYGPVGVGRVFSPKIGPTSPENERMSPENQWLEDVFPTWIVPF